MSRLHICLRGARTLLRANVNGLYLNAFWPELLDFLVGKLNDVPILRHFLQGLVVLHPDGRAREPTLNSDNPAVLVFEGLDLLFQKVKRANYLLIDRE